MADRSTLLCLENGKKMSHGVEVASVIADSEEINGVSPHIGLHLIDYFYYRDNIVKKIIGSEQFLPAEERTFTARLDEAVTDIVNASWGDDVSKLWKTEDTSKTVPTLILPLIIQKDCLVVHAAGNDSSMAKIGLDSAKLLASHARTKNRYIWVVSLLDDGLHLADYTNQPGNNAALQEISISAIGTNMNVLKPGNRILYGRSSGSSLAAPVVTGAACLILGMLKREFPDIIDPKTIVTKALLESAEPIILVQTKDDQERERFGYMLEFETPVALKGVLSKDLSPGNYNIQILGEQRNVTVTEEMIRKSRRKYGRGRLNVIAAMNLAKAYALDKHF
jgi:hypothetical protein